MPHKPFLIIQLRPEDEAADNELMSMVKHGQIAANGYQRLRLETRPLPENLDLNKYSGILVGGSPFDLTTPTAAKSQLQLRIEADFNRLFDQVVSQDFPFIGACSGNGLLGRYCGANISRTYGEPVGGCGY